MLRGVKANPRGWFARVGARWCGVAAVEQRLCSGGNGGRGVLGLGAAIAWEMGLLVRRGWLKRQSRRSRRAGQQGKLAGDLGEMDAGAARSGWRGRKGTLTGWGRRVSGSGENGARGLGCEGDWTGAGWAGAGRGAGPCASGPGEKGRWAAGVRVAAVRERWERALRDWAKRGDVERR